MSFGKHLAVATVFLIGMTVLSTTRAETIYAYAGDLNRLCTSESLIEKALCEGFISSALEIITNGPVGGVVACVPPLVTLPRGVEIAKKWLADHPEESMRSASSAVAQAFANAFPCKK